MKKAIYRKHTGFTLTELIFTIAIVGILITIAIPSLTTMIKNNRAFSQANSLLTSLHLARSEAVKRGRDITLCSSNDSSTCSGTWTDGWIVIDTIVVPPATTPEIFRTWDALEGNPTLVLTGNATTISYSSNGTITAGAVQEFELTPSICTGKHQHKINISLMGRPTATTADCP